MSKVIFSLSESKNGDIKVQIEGTGKELINLLASAIDESDDVKEVVELALLAVNLKAKDEDENEGFLNEMFSKMKATAQA